LRRYVAYWKQRFTEVATPLSEFCAIFEMGEAPKPGKDKKSDAEDKKSYYMIPKTLPEDESIRKKLWNERLVTL